MRLLNVETLRLEEFFGENIPKYAILSHTWGSDEVTFEDIKGKGYRSGTSRKIDGCIETAKRESLIHVWIDTCCIDKSSSSELSEAINSMWSWYKAAFKCYVYLSDVDEDAELISREDSAFRKSRWFTRGWTLQELIAPRHLSFFDSSWCFLGSKDLNAVTAMVVSQITRIPIDVLIDPLGNKFKRQSVAQKMAWAAARTTTRLEDIAYSLLGVFGVNMPLLYGEGTRAFIRLQEEIIRSSDDESIFAGGFLQRFDGPISMLLPTSPDAFKHCENVIAFRPKGAQSTHYASTNKGLHIEMSICYLPKAYGVLLGRLNCTVRQQAGTKTMALPIGRFGDNTRAYYKQGLPVLVPSSLFPNIPGTGPNIYIQSALKGDFRWVFSQIGVKVSLFGRPTTVPITELYPFHWYEIFVDSTSLILLDENARERGQQNITCFYQDVSTWPKFAVKIEYRFTDASLNLERPNSVLRPKDLRCYASFVEEDISLAELLLTSTDGAEEVTRLALNWSEKLTFQDMELQFQLKKATYGGSPFWTLGIEIDRIKNPPYQAAIQI